MSNCGFCLVISRTDSSTESGLLNKASGTDCKIATQSATYIGFTVEARAAGFVSVENAMGWVFMGIGYAYGGHPVATALVKALETANDCETSDIITAAQSLFGQFTLVAYNEQTRSLIAVTDPTGVRSLFLQDKQTSIAVASSMPMLRKLSLLEKQKPDEENQSFLLRYGYNLPGHTAFIGVSEIGPKTLRAIDMESIGDFEDFPAATYQDSNFEDRKLPETIAGKSDSQHENDLLEHLFAACRQQLGDAEKVGVLLGGFDSALVASLLKHLGVEVETYSFHYQAENFNQPYVEQLADVLSIKHRWIQISPETIEDGINRYGETANWPVLWLNYVIQTQHLCKEMAENGVQSCFSGDGCDTVFLGYPSTHRRGALYRKLPQLPPAVANIFRQSIHLSHIEKLLGHIARVGLSLIDAARYPAEQRPVYSFQLFDDANYQRLTGATRTLFPSHTAHFDKFMSDTRDLDYERKIYLAKSLISPNRCKLVSSSDFSSLPIHSPYMHPLVAGFARSLPVEALRPPDESEASREGKYLLMKAAESAGLLPKEIIYQPKLAAISSPIDQWMAGPLKQSALNHLQKLPFAANENYLDDLLSEKALENFYKNNFAADGVVGIAASLLVTYAALFD